MELTLIQQKIFEIRGQKVMLDFDLAVFYSVQTKVLNQAVKRNLLRFPEDFMFQLSEAEFDNLRSRIVTSSWGGRRYLPLAFTEQGIAMLSSVLKSEKAALINIAILRAFVAMRHFALNFKELAQKIAELETMYDQNLRHQRGAKFPRQRKSNPRRGNPRTPKPAKNWLGKPLSHWF